MFVEIIWYFVGKKICFVEVTIFNPWLSFRRRRKGRKMVSAAREEREKHFFLPLDEGWVYGKKRVFFPSSTSFIPILSLAVYIIIRESLFASGVRIRFTELNPFATTLLWYVYVHYYTFFLASLSFLKNFFVVVVYRDRKVHLMR